MYLLSESSRKKLHKYQSVLRFVGRACARQSLAFLPARPLRQQGAEYLHVSVVLLVLFPYRFSPKDSLRHARLGALQNLRTALYASEYMNRNESDARECLAFAAGYLETL